MIGSYLPPRICPHLQAEADDVGNVRDDDGHLAIDELVKHLHCLAGVVLCKRGGREGKRII